MGDTSFFTGPQKKSYAVPALAAGTYQFECQVHPTTMKGTLEVK
jgi:plastocyanin